MMTWRWSGEEGMDLHEALRAASKLITVGSYLEIGVDGGGSLNTLLNEVVPPRIVLCDVWNPEYCGHGDSKSHVLGILQYFNVKATFLDGDSKIMVPRLAELFDLILVDGDHGAEGARADLKNAWPLLRRGGILVMDDINHPNYPWLGTVWAECQQEWAFDTIVEEHGGCNAAMVKKR